MHYTIFIVVRKENHRFHRATVHPKFRSYPKLCGLNDGNNVNNEATAQPAIYTNIPLTIIHLNRCEAVADPFTYRQQINCLWRMYNRICLILTKCVENFSAICRTNEKWSKRLVAISIVALTRLKPSTRSTIIKLNDP